MAKPLTLLESVLVQILVQLTPSNVSDEWNAAGEPYKIAVLVRTGLTKQQANKALGR